MAREFGNEFDEREFLLSILEKTDSDLDDGLDGWVNYVVNDGVLTITFEDADTREVFERQWELKEIS